MSIAIPALKCIAILSAVMTRMIEYIRKIEIDLNLTYKSQISILWPDIIDLLQGASEIFCSLLEPRVHDRKKTFRGHENSFSHTSAANFLSGSQKL